MVGDKLNNKESVGLGKGEISTRIHKLKINIISLTRRLLPAKFSQQTLLSLSSLGQESAIDGVEGRIFPL